MTEDARRWWKQLDVAYKAMGAIISFIGFGMLVGAFMLGGQAQAQAEDISINSAAIRGNTAKIEDMTSCMDTIKSDLTLVRCWVRSDI